MDLKVSAALTVNQKQTVQFIISGKDWRCYDGHRPSSSHGHGITDTEQLYVVLQQIPETLITTTLWGRNSSGKSEHEVFVSRLSVLLASRRRYRCLYSVTRRKFASAERDSDVRSAGERVIRKLAEHYI